MYLGNDALQLDIMAAERSNAAATLKTYSQAFASAASMAPPALKQAMQLSGPLNTLDNVGCHDCRRMARLLSRFLRLSCAPPCHV